MLMEFSKLATASLLLLTLSGCQTQTDPAAAADAGAGAGARAAELPRVQTGRPQRKGIVQSTEQPGQVRAWLQVEIYPRSGGIVEQVLVDIGNVTEPGQLLAVLTAPELEDELRQKQALQRQAEAEIGQAAAAVQLAMATEHSAEADEAEAAAGRRRIESEVARLTSESQRLQGLAESGAVTLRLAEEAVQKLAAAESSLEELAAAVRSAAARRGEARAACIRAEADLKAMEARRDSAAAEVQRLQTLCGYLQIRAPFAGTVTARNAGQPHCSPWLKHHGCESQRGSRRPMPSGSAQAVPPQYEFPHCSNSCSVELFPARAGPSMNKLARCWSKLIWKTPSERCVPECTPVWN